MRPIPDDCRPARRSPPPAASQVPAYSRYDKRRQQRAERSSKGRLCWSRPLVLANVIAFSGRRSPVRCNARLGSAHGLESFHPVVPRAVSTARSPSSTATASESEMSGSLRQRRSRKAPRSSCQLSDSGDAIGYTRRRILSGRSALFSHHPSIKRSSRANSSEFEFIPVWLTILPFSGERERERSDRPIPLQRPVSRLTESPADPDLLQQPCGIDAQEVDVDVPEFPAVPSEFKGFLLDGKLASRV